MDLQVSRQPIFELLSKNTFFIPAYQREYAWDEEQCGILWEDLTQFHIENKEREKKGEERDYFLGTIVCHEHKEGQRRVLQIIDGQQRIITLALLLKAMYRTLEKMKEDEGKSQEKIQGLQSTIAPCVWHIDSMTRKPFFKQPRINTRVYTNPEYNRHLEKVFSDYDLKGDVKFDKNYKYVQNYIFLIDKIKNLPTEELGIDGNLFDFIVSLEKCVLLPITCKDFEMGLTIFQTLNDRGLPLSDTDIFKQQLYENHGDGGEQARKDFIDNWSTIHDICDEGKVKININDLFKYYMHIIRAQEQKTDNIKAIRPFYLKEQKKYLSDKKEREKLIVDITNQAKIWSAIYNEFPRDDDERFKDIDENSKKYLQILSAYPNEWWQNIVSVLWHKCDGKQLNTPLRQIIAALYFLFIKHRNVVSIKPKAYTINNNIFHGREILHKVFAPEDITKEAITKLITNFIEERTHSKIVKGLLVLYAYLNTRQKHVPSISTRYHTEHILPKKWEDPSYHDWTKETAKHYIESIGNKVLCKNKINIQAGNGYFNKKKKKYRESSIKELRSLSESKLSDWLPDNIEEREEKMKEAFIQLFLDEFKRQ